MATHRAKKERRTLLLQLLVFAVIAGIGGAIASSWVRGGAEPEPAPSASESMTLAPSSEPMPWPVETVAPPEEPVRGEGTFLDPAEVDRSDPDAVAEAVAMLLSSHDALLDASESSARSSARDLMDPALFEGPQPARTSPGAEWLAAQKHQAYSSPAVTPVEIPLLSHDHAGETAEEHAAHEGRVGAPAVSAAGEEVLAYQYDVKYHWTGRDGWISEPDDVQVRVALLELTERDGVWVATKAFYGKPQELSY